MENLRPSMLKLVLEPNERLRKASIEGDVEEVKKALLSGAEVNEVDIYTGKTPLYLAAENGHYKVVTSLLSSGAQVNAKDHKGRTPICMASKFGHLESVKALISAGADVNSPVRRGGRTP